MRIIDADKIRQKLNPDDWGTPDERWRPEREFGELIDQASTVDQWHYPSKGELPDKDGEYLCRYYKYDIRFSKVLRYRVEDNKWYNLVYEEEYRAPKPDAWQYIVPPKEVI